MEFKLKPFEKVLEVTKIANIHYFEFVKEYHTFKDRHAFRELLYVDSGFIRVESESYTGIIEENQLIIHKSNEIHSLMCPGGESANVIIIGFECDSEELDSLSSNPIILSDIQIKLLTEIIKEGRNVFLPPYDVPNQRDMKKRANFIFGADQMIKLKMETLFIELIRSETVGTDEDAGELSGDKIQEIHRYLTDNFREKITLGELCFLFGTNKTTLCSGFRAMYGETVVSYINKLRIKDAKRLIRKGGYNLTEISSVEGFSSVHYFSRIFKQYEKQAPTTYIKKVKERMAK